MQKVFTNSNHDSFHSFELYMEDISRVWSAAWSGKRWWLNVSCTLLCLIPLYIYLVPYLQYIEHRQGIVLNDFFLNHLASRDLSPFIFGLVYSCAAFVLLYSIRSPWILLRNIQIFLIMQYIRNVCLYLVPLSAPHGIIPLHDPILEFIAYDQKPLLQDLFFSGHTAAVVVFALLTKKNNYLFTAFVMISVLMAYLLMVQHCHYTIDIIGGVMFAILSYHLVNALWERLNLSMHLNNY